MPSVLVSLASLACRVSHRVGLKAVAVVGMFSFGVPVPEFVERRSESVAAPAITLVAPVLTSGSRAVVRTRQPIIRALFLPSGSAIDTAATVLKWRGVIVTGLARHNRGLIEWEVDSTRWLGIGDSALAEVTACDGVGACATVSRWVVLENDQKPVLGFTGMPLEALNGGFSAPFGPGLAVRGAEVETEFRIPSYTSMGVGRTAGLVYSTRQSYPRALVSVDLELPWPTGTPDQVKLVLIDGAARLDSLVLTNPTCATGGAQRCRAVLQGDFSASSFATPTRKWLKVEASVTEGGTTKSGTDSTEVVLVDRRATYYGSGWWPAEVSQVIAAGSDRLLVYPNGTAAVYRGNGDSVYIPPPGVHIALVKMASGWELRPRGSLAKDVFDANGRLVKSIDQNDNKDSIAYGALPGQVTKFIDPVGKTVTLAYNGSNKLTTLTDPGGRQSKVTINGTNNKLTSDSLSSPTTRSNRTDFVYRDYPGSFTLVLLKRIGVVTDTTIITYDSTFKRRPTQSRLPQVKNESGSTVNPVIEYVSYERKGFGGFVSLDSVYAEIKDPRNNWTRALLNRWGESRKTWDAVGVICRKEYTPEGYLIWSEGKNGDSSRVYQDYDNARRPVRTWITRGGAVLRIDSLVYDGNHRVVQQIDPRGEVSRTGYDANGNVILTITPANDTTQMWYRSDGLLDSTRLPGHSRSSRVVYDATWKNVSQEIDPAGEILVTKTLDTYGRTTIEDRKVEVQVSGGAVTYQWRRTQRYLNVANQGDSIVTLRTSNCAAPCNTPSWPLPSDTLRTQRVAFRFDRAGRDSLRLNSRGIATLYLYDRLGRILSRRPWTDSMAVKDSMLYDVADNLKKVITRRGHTITADYDARNRDTLAVIPGVGTLRRRYLGPQDQLTRQWYDSPVDSIGGINGELRWGYDTRGRLGADTSYTGSTARVTTYAYDQWERIQTVTNAAGTRTSAYEAARGFLDTLITSFGDTLTYVHDMQGRPVGPYIRSGGLRHWSELGWNPNQSLDSIGTITKSGGSNVISGRYLRLDATDDGYVALDPMWVEQHGIGAPMDSLQDVVAYDGWERLISWTALKNGFAVAAATYQFDRSGNVSQAAGAATYHSVTDRLSSIAESGGNRLYVYDRAGNLVQEQKNSWTRTFGYDALNRLTVVRENGNVVARYAYDVLSRRIAKRVYPAATFGTPGYTRFVYDGQQVAFQTDSSGTIGLRFTWGTGFDNLLGVRDAAGEDYYIVKDKLGSTRGLFERDGTWRVSVRFDPYGELVAIDTSGPKPPIWYAWTGREYDEETDLYYHRARYYSSTIRRFVQEDPIAHDGGANLYAYVEGQALEATDPTGTMMKDVSRLDEGGGAQGGGGGGGGGGGDPEIPVYLPTYEFTYNFPVNNGWMLNFVPRAPPTYGPRWGGGIPRGAGGGSGGYQPSAPKPQPPPPPPPPGVGPIPTYAECREMCKRRGATVDKFCGRIPRTSARLRFIREACFGLAFASKTFCDNWCYNNFSARQ